MCKIEPIVTPKAASRAYRYLGVRPILGAWRSARGSTPSCRCPMAAVLIYDGWADLYSDPTELWLRARMRYGAQYVEWFLNGIDPTGPHPVGRDGPRANLAYADGLRCRVAFIESAKS